MNPLNFTPVRVHKHLLGPEEKARVVVAMRATKRSVRYWSATFKRLPATIVKIAAEFSIPLSRT